MSWDCRFSVSFDHTDDILRCIHSCGTNNSNITESLDVKSKARYWWHNNNVLPSCLSITYFLLIAAPLKQKCAHLRNKSFMMSQRAASTPIYLSKLFTKHRQGKERAAKWSCHLPAWCWLAAESELIRTRLSGSPGCQLGFGEALSHSGRNYSMCGIKAVIASFSTS